MDRKAMTVWTLRPVSGGVPKRGSKILQELHPTKMFDELSARVGFRITKQHTWYREPLQPSLKLALTLRHLASGSKYSNMNYAWRIPHDNQSLAVREIYQAIIDEYILEMITCPTTPEGWRAISDKFPQEWNFLHTCGALNGKHITCKCPPKSGSQYLNYNGFYSVVLMALLDADCKFIWADLGSTESASDALIYNNSENKELSEDETIRFPAPDSLPNDYQYIPYFFTGDDAFALQDTMRKP